MNPLGARSRRVSKPLVAAVLLGLCLPAAPQVKPLNAVDRPIIAGGQSHVLVIRDDGTVWGFGASTHGQLGTGWKNPNFLTLPSEVTNVVGAVAVAAGNNHSLVLD